MKQHILPAVKLTILCLVVFAGFYTILIWGIAQATPNRGQGETISVNNKIIGYKLEGQNFTGDNYFNGRPSACGYNAAASGASNKGPSNPDYLKDVENKIDTFLMHNPTIKREAIPSELVTSSGSGLDPDLSPQGVYVQIPRIAKARKIPEDKIRSLVDKQIEKPLFGLFGTERINILILNVSLDALK